MEAEFSSLAGADHWEPVEASLSLLQKVIDKNLQEA